MKKSWAKKREKANERGILLQNARQALQSKREDQEPSEKPPKPLTKKHKMEILQVFTF
jgi:hypothetical protein